MPRWESSRKTNTEKCEEGWPALVAAADEVAQAREKTDVLAELLALRGLCQVVDDETVEAVVNARTQGLSWSTIGRALDIAPQTAHQRYKDADSHGYRPPPPKPTQWWKLNLRAEHLTRCLSELKFGTQRLLTWESGDVLLLQLNKGSRPDPHARITSALVYDTYHVDENGESIRLWGEKYAFILDASEFLPTKPFSLEDIAGLGGLYSRQGQMNHQRIRDEHVPTVAKTAGLQHLLDQED